MLRSQPGIHSVKVALLAERGVVEFDPLQWNAEKVVSVSIFLVLRDALRVRRLTRSSPGNIRYWF